VLKDVIGVDVESIKALGQFGFEKV